MVQRYSWIAGLIALGFAFAQLNGLLRPTGDGVPWQFVVIAAGVLGIIITWAGITYRMPAWAVILLNGVALLVAITFNGTHSSRGRQDAGTIPGAMERWRATLRDPRLWWGLLHHHLLAAHLVLHGRELSLTLNVGLGNGLLVTKRRVPPFVATLGMLVLVQGAQQAYTRGVPGGFVPETVAIGLDGRDDTR